MEGTGGKWTPSDKKAKFAMDLAEICTGGAIVGLTGMGMVRGIVMGTANGMPNGFRGIFFIVAGRKLGRNGGCIEAGGGVRLKLTGLWASGGNGGKGKAAGSTMGIRGW